MIQNKKLIIFFLFSFLSLHGQQIKIILQNSNVDIIKKNDSILQRNGENEFLYEKSELEKDMYFTISNKKFLLKDIADDVKYVVVDFSSKAKNGCYVVSRITNDLIQSYNLDRLESCNCVTNISLYNEFDKNKKPVVKMKINK